MERRSLRVRVFWSIRCCFLSVRYPRTVYFQIVVRYSIKPTFAFDNTLFSQNSRWLAKYEFLYFLEFCSIFFLLFGMSDKNVPILVSGAFRFNSIFHSIIGWKEYYCVWYQPDGIIISEQYFRTWDLTFQKRESRGCWYSCVLGLYGPDGWTVFLSLMRG